MQSLGPESQKYNSSNVHRFGGWLAVLIAAWTVCPAGRARGADATNNPPSSPSDPVLDLMLEKGMITEDEAAKVQAQVDARRTNMAAQFPASAWKVNTGVKGLELFGDVRTRYEGRSATDPAGNNIDQQRLRYALRFGLRGDLFDDFYFGFRLETAANPRSPWVTLGTSSSTSGPYQGPFGKSTDGINVGQIYLGWHPQDWVDIEMGKLPNPLYTTPMVWDSDLNPEGAAEHFKYTVGEADLFATMGQFLYGDFNPNSASSGLGVNGLLGQNTQNIFMFAWQGGVNYHISPDTSAKIAATLYNYTGLERSSQYSGNSLAPYFGDPYVGEGAYYYAGGSARGYAPGYGGYSPGTTGGATGNFVPGYGSTSYPFNQVGLNDLLVVEVPFEINFKISKQVAARFFGDVAYNLDGAQRAKEAASAYSYIESQAPPTQNVIAHSFPAQTHDVKAYQFGFGIGSTNFVSGPMQGVVYGTSNHKHAWEFRTYWQHIEQYSLDPNLIDSDFFEGRENMQGIYAAFAYCFSENVYGVVRYGYASRINNLLGTGGSNQDTPQMNPINSYNLLQVDLGVRF
jgi:hypothetical protein